MNIKTIVLSDLHQDFWKSNELTEENIFKLLKVNPKEEYDLVILAGDISETGKAVDQARCIIIFKAFCKLGVPVILIKGNHENYRSTLTDSKFFYATLQKELKTLNNLYFLEKQHIDLIIKGKPVRIFGATLWTDFNKKDPLALLEANMKMNDFSRMIGKPGFLKFLAEDAYQEHQLTLDALYQSSKNLPKDSKFIVVTHHAPLQDFCDNFRKLRNWEQTIELLDYSYFSDLSDYIQELPNKPSYWISGHIHSPLEFERFGVKFLSNPYGYPTVYEKRLYKDPIKELEL